MNKKRYYFGDLLYLCIVKFIFMKEKILMCLKCVYFYITLLWYKIVNNNKAVLLKLKREVESLPNGIWTEEDYKKFEKITDFIYDRFDVTFGNRILNQIETLVPTFIACGGKKEDVLDFLLSRKVLAKLEGRFEEYVKPTLKQLLALLDKTYGEGVFAKSEKAINVMMRRL